MEPLFWILLIGVGCLFGGAVVAGIIGGIMSTVKSGKYAKKYIACGVITAEQKKQLPAILLQKGRESLAAGRVGEAISYLNDCLELGKLRASTEQKDDATATLAKCYAASGNKKKAMDLLGGIFTPEADLLRAELLLERNQYNDFDNAAYWAGKAMEDEALRAQAEAVVQKSQQIGAAKEEQKARERFEAALKQCESLDPNPDVQRVRYIAPGNHFRSLEKYLEMYNAITGYATAEQRKSYAKELSLIAFQIASMCCAFGLQGIAFAYLQQEDGFPLPQKDFLYAMLYARYGFDELYADRVIKYPADVIEEYRNKMERQPLPPIDYEKALEYAERAKQGGVPEAAKLISKIEFIREYRRQQQERQEMLDRIQRLWDREFEKKHGMSRDEYEEEMEERLEAERERLEREAEEAAKAERRAERLEHAMDASEMLQDKLHGGKGRTMEEKWQLGEITAEQYMDYKNKRDRELDTLK